MLESAWRWIGRFVWAGMLWVGAGCGATPDAPREPVMSEHGVLRIAVFNTALSMDEPGALAERIGDRSAPLGEAAVRDEKLGAIAEVIGRVDPAVLVLLEVDRDAAERIAQNLDLHLSEDVAREIGDVRKVSFAQVYVPEVNTGVPSGVDLDRDGGVGGPGDAYGWGEYPGHYGIVVLVKHDAHIVTDEIRTFRKMRWRDYPGNVMPAEWYGDAAEHVRLSSKTHADVPIEIRGSRLHLLISHPTPPVFDGPEDRNGRRNHDEIEFWLKYLNGASFTDDAGVTAALPTDAPAVVLGDLNADPYDGDSYGLAIRRLLAHPRLNGDALTTPASVGAERAAAEQAGVNAEHLGPPQFDTADFADDPPRGPGNLRVDYVLPPAVEAGAVGWHLRNAGVFWPMPRTPGAEAAATSDHRLVWVDLAIPINLHLDEIGLEVTD